MTIGWVGMFDFFLMLLFYLIHTRLHTDQSCRSKGKKQAAWDHLLVNLKILHWWACLLLWWVRICGREQGSFYSCYWICFQ